MCDALRELFADELEEERVKGEIKGRESTEKRLTSLIQRLLGENLLDDLRRVSEDRTYRDQMYQKYGL